MNYRLFIFLFFTVQISFCSTLKVNFQHYTNLAKFAAKHACSEQVEAELRKGCMSDRYIIKGQDLSRMDNQRRIEQLLDEQGVSLNRIEVPKKCISIQNDFLVVVAERAYASKIREKEPITLQEAEQLQRLAIKTGLRDLHNQNIIRNDEGKFVPIDLEQQSFDIGEGFPYWLSRQKLNPEMYSSGFEVDSSINNYRIDHDKKYDDPEIDFMQVIAENHQYSAALQRTKNQKQDDFDFVKKYLDCMLNKK